MDNHVHIIVRPQTENGLRIIGEAHRRYAYYLNARMGWKGYLWQGRFSSFPMDERYFYEALRYVELNPVRAKLCERPSQYPWSSARQRVSEDGARDLKVAVTDMIEDWEKYWKDGLERDDIWKTFRKNEALQDFIGIRPKETTLRA